MPGVPTPPHDAVPPRRDVQAGPPATRARSVRIVSPAPSDVWTSVWEASAEATIFHRPEWLEACCQTAGFENVSRLYETADGERFVLPLARSRSVRGTWRTAWSIPMGWGFGGAFGTRSLAADDVALMLDEVLQASPRLVVNPGPVTRDAWTTVPGAVRVRHDTHVVDVRAGFDSLWSGIFSSDTRNKVRKSEKRGVEVEWGPGTVLMSVYWDVFLRWTRQRAMERKIPTSLAVALAERREPLIRYEAIARHLGDRCQVAVARVGGQPAAAVIVLLDGDHGHYWRAASDQALVRRQYANHLLVARVLERAAQRGCSYVHMGESGGKRTLIEFKEHFGAKPVSYHELRFGPRAVMAATQAREQLVRKAERLAVRSATRLRRSAAR